MTTVCILSTLLVLLLASTSCFRDTTTALPKPRIFQTGFAFLNRPFALYCSLPPSENLGIVFVWYRDETELKVLRSSVLEFPNVTEADRGVYTCQISDGEPQTTSPTSDPVTVYPQACSDCWCGGCATPAMSVNADSSRDLPAATTQRGQRRKRRGMVPKPTIFQQDVPICGLPFILECVVLDGYGINSKTRYTWYKDFVEIKGQSSILLKIAILQEEDAGEYVCTAREGPVDTTSPPSQAYHLNPLVPPVVHMEPSSLNSTAKGILGKNLTLTCNVTKAIPWVPENGYSWSFLPSHEKPLLPLRGNAQTLTLGPLTRKDSGQYSCTASSGEYFKDPLDLKGHASIYVDVVYLENISVSSHEEIVEGDHVTLTCKVDSHPPARLTWLVNGREARHVTDNLDHYVIMNASCADSGSYLCRASNHDLPGQEMNATAKLHVRCYTDIAVDETTQTPVDKEPLPTDQDETTTWTTIFIVETLVIVLFCIGFVVLGVLYCRKHGSRIEMLLHKGLTFLESAWRTSGQKNSKNEGSTEKHAVEVECGTTGSGVPLLPNSENLRRRKTAGSKGSQENLKPRFEGTDTPLLQTQKVQFDQEYANGMVYVIPPASESTTPQQVTPDIVEQRDEDRDDEKLKEGNAKTCIVELLNNVLKELAHRDDAPAFIFTHAMPDDRSIVIYHSAYGVIVVHVDGTSDPESSSLLNKAEELVQEMPDKTKEDLKCLLEGEVVSLLALPNSRNQGNSREDTVELHDEEDVRRRANASSHKTPERRNVLYGTNAGDYKAWLTKLSVHPVWRRDPKESFEKAVSRYLSVKVFRDSTTGVEISSDSPSGCLATPRQAAVVHSTDRLVHLWGPQGTGKTALLVNRARQWLREGKNVIMAVANPRFELLLDTVGRWTLHGKTCDKAKKLVLCRDAGKFKKAVKDLREQHQSEDICAILDEASNEFFSFALDALQSEDIAFLWTAHREDLTKEEETRFQAKQGQRFLLEDPIQYATNVINLARLKDDKSQGPSNAVHSTAHASHAGKASIGFLPSLGDRLRSFFKRPCSQTPLLFGCDNCEDWLRSSIHPLAKGLSMEAEEWRRWVVLLTGDWGSDTKLTRKLVDWLRRQGIPAVLEWQPDNETSNLRVCNLLGLERDKRSSADSLRAAARARVAFSKDIEGQPAVHVIHSVFFKGLDKPSVLVVHYDWRDEHPDHQSEAQQNSRLSDHRQQLHGAMTRCQQELAVCFLSTSPAVSHMLQLHPTNEGN